MKINKVLKKITDNFLDLIFPTECLGCQKEGSFLCSNCLKTIPIDVKIICPICKKGLLKSAVCKGCQSRSFLDGVFFATNYENELVEEVIKKFKYSYIQGLKIPLNKIILNYLKKIRENSNFDSNILNRNNILIPIPLHKKRLVERGFNQSEFLGQELSRVLEVKLFNNHLVRIKNTAPQAELSKSERFNNIKDSFQVLNKAKIQGKNIILVDDVFTTGATLQEAAKVLKRAKATRVWGLTIAHG